jgi:hypothetical protein
MKTIQTNNPIYCGSFNHFYIPEIKKDTPTHPGIILDWEGDWLLISFLSTKPMKKFFGSKWNNQEIIPKGEGNKDKDSYYMPNQTSWIHKSQLIGHIGTFSQYYIDLSYSDNEKFYGKKFEDIQFKKILKINKYHN